jgi:hypothetical protein
MLAIGLSLASTARAAAPEGCPMYFPDLRCDRHGRYEGFSAPMSFPYLFEDPFITTGVYAWGLWHEFPERSVFQGGDATVAAVQLRLAITDRLGLIATQDGFTNMRPDNPLLDSEQGYMDLIAGLKYALIDRPDDRFILSGSLRYKTSQGTRSILQGGGEGGWLPGLSLAYGTGETHVIADVGSYFPVDGDAESSFAFYNLHVDYSVSPRFAPFVELNGIYWIDEGDGSQTVKLSNGARLPISAIQAALGTGPFEGLDVANLGSQRMNGKDYISGAAGFRFAVADRISLGLAYERPLTRTRSITKQRATVSVAFEL